jgi:hypothetical protein
MTFNPNQCRTLATSGTRADIGFFICRVQDYGAAFLEALAAREDSQTGLTTLRIESELPFAECILVLAVHIAAVACRKCYASLRLSIR